jgi:hypothetical protein
MSDSTAKSGGAWTIPILCIGLALLACAVIIPQVEENRRLVWEREKLQRDLAQLDKQAEINQEFLDKLGRDPALAERLAQRQMKMIRSGTNVLEIKGEEQKEEMSPFQLVTVPPPGALEAYKPVGGLAAIFLERRVATYVMGAAFLMIAAGLVLGASEMKPQDDKVRG